MSGIMSMLLGAVSSAAAAVDEFFNRVTLLLPGNGTNGAQNNTFLDSSTNNFTITRNGNTTQGTFSPFSQTGWSNFFDGTNDFLQKTSPSSALYDWTSTNWTLEFWIYANAFGQGANTESNVFGNATDGGATSYWTFGTISTGAVKWYYYNGGSVQITTTTTLSTGRWYHLAFVNNSNNLTIYIDGVSSATGTKSGTPQFSSGTPITLGKISSSFNGYISNLRITQSAVYTSNFTPSTTPLTAISGTQLLMCQSNRFLDNSTNAVVFTPSGDVSVQAFSPFAPTAAYSAATVGGSGYFDGSGDYLSNSSDTIIPSTGDFTAQFWIYPTQVSSLQYLIATTNNTGNKLHLYINSSAYVGVQTGGAYSDSSTTKVVANAWNHIACTRTGSTYALFVNGVSQSISGTGTMASTLDVTPTYIAARDAGNGAVSGYLGSSRITTVVETISVPTAPYTSDGNTRLLTNFTNAGITDATAKNVLETVGNAQISTTQSKFGGSSMYFDGNGDNLAIPANVDLNCHTGNFTVEAWVYISSRTLNYPLIVGNNNGSYSAGAIALTNSNNDSASYFDKFVLSVYDIATPTLVASSTNSSNTWYHLAIVRNGTTLTMYRDGVSVASTTISSAAVFNWGKLGLRVGGGNWDAAQSYFNGYIDDLRITKGYARYTAAFTPPTSAFALQ